MVTATLRKQQQPQTGDSAAACEPLIALPCLGRPGAGAAGPRYRQFKPEQHRQPPSTSPGTTMLSSAWPAGATEAWICYVAVAVFLPTAVIVRALQLPFALSAVVIAAVPVAVIVTLEAMFLQTPARASTGLQFKYWSPDLGVVGFKLVGFHAILAFICFVYYVTNEYTKEMYVSWFWALRAVWPWFWPAAVAYFYVVDGWQTDSARKEDLYHNVGRLLLGQGTVVPVPAARWHNMAREYTVKAYFLPLMAIYYQGNLRALSTSVPNLVKDIFNGTATFWQFYDVALVTIYFVDVCWGMIGYSLSLKLFDSHVRSAEPTTIGWVFALACYPPFMNAYMDAYLPYHGQDWNIHFNHSPRWFFILWGSVILVLTAIYTWATISFGVRFSNLTNRGIITIGPYSFMRHPAYVCKNLSWWMIAVPWSLHDGWGMALKRCVRLALLNLTYYGRAKTEEAHLLHDPAYVEYFNALQARYGLERREVLREWGREAPTSTTHNGYKL